MSKARYGSGTVRRLPSGKYQARVYGLDGKQRAVGSYMTRKDAERALADARVAAGRSKWGKTDGPTQTLTQYAEVWLAERRVKPRTSDHYRALLDHHVLPGLGSYRLRDISPALVRQWHSELTTGPTMQVHAYGLLRTILGTAVTDDIIAANPCHIRGAGTAKRTSKTEIATVEELATITEAVPDRYRAMILLAAWCSLRQGELFELRRADLDLPRAVVHVRRGVVRAGGQVIVGDPKSVESKRNVPIPPHILPALEHHLTKHTGPKKDALLFPARHGGHMAPATLYKVFYPARNKAGRPDLRFHDLRHTGATLSAQVGATVAELMARLGHSTASAAMRYQHAAEGRGQIIATALSDIATGGTVVPLRKPASKASKPA